ncbi:phospholipid methyltransferase-domain-containing protein [Dioszegia hungarica]|uniref:Phosphatidyl-N-methylethanolamine N-methyltransferase n=1 Tax=Dioszegia hungarica TaxID=4972 RepID=A0AA38H126_9TREE|nr:phospholipid methyltransferase-domain-containing protein [Dioszegia hungarica]KAI9631820.1 phospholipid methyltransferase-domain-containing protein [Dioszegia hungarica]
MDALAKHLPLEKLPSWVPVHHLSQPHVYNYLQAGQGVGKWVDWSQGSLWAAVGMVLFNPIFWNVVARNEYRNKSMTKIFQSPYYGCYVLAVSIFSLGIIRDLMYERALRLQPAHPALSHPLVQSLAYALIALGQLFVITSIYALGVTGTYLGDYFGILMKSRVTGFPFNVLNDPMYVGSTLAFVGGALLYKSPAGLGISGLVWAVYAVALKYEGPFTDKIYSAAASKKNDDAPTGSGSSSGSGSGSTPAKTPSPDADALAGEDKQTQPLPSQTPRARRIRKESGEKGVGSPARMTRSRSRGVGLGDETD